MLSRDDIRAAIAEGHLKIFPFEEKNFTGIGYNLSTTNFALSLNLGVLLTIHSEISSLGETHFVYIAPNDTVLFFSKECIEVDETLAGTFHSKVSRACQGLGHISTTLDPTWKGQLIIAVNNPTMKEIRFELDKNSGNIMTLTLYRLMTPVTGKNIHDNNQGRGDLLLEAFAKPSIKERYREQYLQLKEFVAREFATSLNGDDNFLTSSQPADKYSQRISRLLDLDKRIKKDLDIIREDRYSLGKNGNYVALKDESEVQLLKSCVLYSIKLRNNEKSGKEKNEASCQSQVEQRENNKYQAYINLSRIIYGNDAWPVETETGKPRDELVLQKVIAEYIDIIEYELDMLEHIRRIEWQNKKILEYTEKESEYSQFVKEIENRMRRKKRVHVLLSFVPLFLAMAASVVFYFWRPADWLDYSGLIFYPLAAFITPLLLNALNANEELSRLRKKK